ncbi:MAG: DUF2860 family protein [Oceanicoccus sp.]
MSLISNTSPSVIRRALHTASGALVILATSQALAFDPIPQESGVSGFINLGAGAARVESNFLASILNGNVDLSEEKNNSLSNSPDGETFGMPAVAFNLAYTFADTRTQIYFGPTLEDFLRFDMTTNMGIRQELSIGGTLDFSLTGTPIKTKVWRDPYLTDESRSSTNRDTYGYKFSWDGILNTGLEVQVSSREVEYDSENSGIANLDPNSGLPLTVDQIALLDRNGNIDSIKIGYGLKTETAGLFKFSVSDIDHDLDGDAMSYDGILVEINNAYSLNKRDSLVTNIAFGSFEYSENNPIFDERADKDRIGFSMAFFRTQPFGIKGWVGNVSAVYYEEDSDIDFFDNKVTMLNVGMIKRF